MFASIPAVAAQTARVQQEEVRVGTSARITGATSNGRDQLQARRCTVGRPTFLPEAHEMLRILGNNHLRDVTNDEWARYGARRSISETLCGDIGVGAARLGAFAVAVASVLADKPPIMYVRIRRLAPEHQPLLKRILY